MKRRRFLKVTSLGSAAVASTFCFPSLSDDRKIKIGLIGTGWYGMVDIKAALKIGGVEVIAICDVDSDHLSNSAIKLENWYALHFIAACDKGLDMLRKAYFV